MTTVQNLDQFLRERGFDTPYAWARALYKYVDCGPWVQFLVETTPAKTETQTAKITNVGNRPWLNNPKELTTEFIQFLGFKTRAYKGGKETYQGYIKLVENYMTQKCVGSGNNQKLQLIKHDNPEYIIVQTTWETPAEISKVYYEDPNVDTFDQSKCVGLTVGSIVEGSDVEIGPHTLLFPFEMGKFDKVIENVDSEALFYWERDNSQWFCVTSHGNVGLRETWGEYHWEDPDNSLTADQKKYIEEMMVTRDFDPTYDVPFNVGEFTLVEYLNDCIWQ